MASKRPDPKKLPPRQATASIVEVAFPTWAEADPKTAPADKEVAGGEQWTQVYSNIHGRC